MHYPAKQKRRSRRNGQEADCIAKKNAELGDCRSGTRKRSQSSKRAGEAEAVKQQTWQKECGGPKAQGLLRKMH